LKTLAILDRKLAAEPFLAGERYTVADMSVYAYVHLAADAQLPLPSYSNVVAWIARVQSQDRFLRTTHSYSIDPKSLGEL
jgi:glutathione S-transferase